MAPPRAPHVVELKDYPDVKLVADSNNKFSLICSKVLRTTVQGNLVYSPFCLRNLLGMAQLGAHGETAEEIHNALLMPENEAVYLQGHAKILAAIGGQINQGHGPAGIHLEEASRFYIKGGFEISPEFAGNLLEIFRQEIHTQDFCEPHIAAAAINSWIDGATNSRISHVVSPNSLNQYTRLLLVSGVHFNGDWADKFDRRSTKKGIFRVTEKKSVDVDFMYKKTSVFFANLVDLDAQAISLPYQTRQFSLLSPLCAWRKQVKYPKGDHIQLTIILPKTPGALALARLKNDVSAPTFLDKLRLEQGHQMVEITLPRFRIESTIHFIQPLKQLGIRTMFDPSAADFSRITGYPMKDLYMTEIIQKVSMEVDEGDRTEVVVQTKNKFGMGGGIKTAATATSAGGSAGGKGGRAAIFLVDHPFLFSIADKLTGVILFSGTCANPISKNI